MMRRGNAVSWCLFVVSAILSLPGMAFVFAVPLKPWLSASAVGANANVERAVSWANNSVFDSLAPTVVAVLVLVVANRIHRVRWFMWIPPGLAAFGFALAWCQTFVYLRD